MTSFLSKRKESKKGEKLAIGSMFFLALAIFYGAFTKDFVPSSSLRDAAYLVSAVLTIIVLLIVFYIFTIGGRKPGPAWYKYSFLKKSFTIVFFPVMVFVAFLVVSLFSLPRLYTSFIGLDAVKMGVMVKDTDFGRSHCDYFLEPQYADGAKAYAHECISKRLYNNLPDVEYDAKLFVKESGFGYIIRSFTIYYDGVEVLSL